MIRVAAQFHGYVHCHCIVVVASFCSFTVCIHPTVQFSNHTSITQTDIACNCVTTQPTRLTLFPLDLLFLSAW